MAASLTANLQRIGGGKLLTGKIVAPIEDGKTERSSAVNHFRLSRFFDLWPTGLLDYAPAIMYTTQTITATHAQPIRKPTIEVRDGI